MLEMRPTNLPWIWKHAHGWPGRLSEGSIQGACGHGRATTPLSLWIAETADDRIYELEQGRSPLDPVIREIITEDNRENMKANKL